MLDANLKNLKLKLFKDYKENVTYSLNSWDGYFYNHTNEDAEDFKIDKCTDLIKQDWKPYIPAKNEVLIGGLTFLKNWILRSEVSNALAKIFV